MLCAICVKAGCFLIADCCDGDRNEIERDPRGLGDKYFEGASRTFYSRYMEYKKRVAHANAGGAIQREVVSIAELIPSHLQKVFARVYHKSRTITGVLMSYA